MRGSGCPIWGDSGWVGDQGYPGWGFQVVPGCPVQGGLWVWEREELPLAAEVAESISRHPLRANLGSGGAVQRHRKRWVSFIADAVAAVIQVVIKVSRQEGWGAGRVGIT